ncbi:MAG: DUF1428 domain-containing protein [Hellea sp.]|nr:DUF1428 domain-containing protein [Hellea sp.]
MYIDGFVYAVSEARKEEFIDFAQKSAELFKKYGALRVVETWAEEVPDGEVTSMPLAVKLEEGEAVVFSWIEWPSKQIRNVAYEAMVPDIEAAGIGKMPFDGKRMTYGGFEPVVDV